MNERSFIVKYLCAYEGETFHKASSSGLAKCLGSCSTSLGSAGCQPIVFGRRSALARKMECGRSCREQRRSRSALLLGTGLRLGGKASPWRGSELKEPSARLSPFFFQSQRGAQFIQRRVAQQIKTDHFHGSFTGAASAPAQQ